MRIFSAVQGMGACQDADELNTDFGSGRLVRSRTSPKQRPLARGVPWGERMLARGVNGGS